MSQNYSGNKPINIGTGKDYPIQEVAAIIQEIIGFEGEIFYDTSKPDGVLMKLQDTAFLTQLGWVSQTNLREGILKSYEHFLYTVDQL